MCYLVKAQRLLRRDLEIETNDKRGNAQCERERHAQPRGESHFGTVVSDFPPDASRLSLAIQVAQTATLRDGDPQIGLFDGNDLLRPKVTTMENRLH